MTELTHINELLAKELEKSNLDGFEILTSFRKDALTRYANNVIHQQVESGSTFTNLRGYKGKKLGTVSASISENNISKVVQNLVETIKVSPEIPFFKGLAKEQKYQNFKPIGENYTAENAAEIVSEIVNIGTDLDPRAKLFGKVERIKLDYALLTSNGLEGSHSIRLNDLKILSIIEEGEKRGFGREVAANKTTAKPDVETLTQSAVQISKDTLEAKSVDVGEYPVVLAPQAGAELLSYTLFQLSASPYHQKYSPFSDRLGEQVLSSNFVLYDSPLNPESLMATPFDAEGVPTKNQNIFENGVPKSVFYSILSASEFLGDPSLASGLMGLPYSDYSFGGSGPSNISMKTGDSSREEMISETKRGLYVQTFWYTNIVNGPKGVITGLTRDGLYLIEDGEIKHAVKNLRFTDSLLKFFKSVDLISNTQTALLDEFGNAGNIPFYKLENLRFVSKSKH